MSVSLNSKGKLAETNAPEVTAEEKEAFIKKAFPQHVDGLKQYIESEFKDNNMWTSMNMSFEIIESNDTSAVFAFKASYKEHTAQAKIEMKGFNSDDRFYIHYIVLNPENKTVLRDSNAALWAGPELNDCFFLEVFYALNGTLGKIDDAIYSDRRFELDKAHFKKHIEELELQINNDGNLCIDHSFVTTEVKEVNEFHSIVKVHAEYEKIILDIRISVKLEKELIDYKVYFAGKKWDKSNKKEQLFRQDVNIAFINNVLFELDDKLSQIADAIHKNYLATDPICIKVGNALDNMPDIEPNFCGTTSTFRHLSSDTQGRISCKNDTLLAELHIKDISPEKAQEILAILAK